MDMRSWTCGTVAPDWPALLQPVPKLLHVVVLDLSIPSIILISSGFPRPFQWFRSISEVLSTPIWFGRERTMHLL